MEVRTGKIPLPPLASLLAGIVKNRALTALLLENRPPSQATADYCTGEVTLEGRLEAAFAVHGAFKAPLHFRSFRGAKTRRTDHASWRIWDFSPNALTVKHLIKISGEVKRIARNAQTLRLLVIERVPLVCDALVWMVTGKLPVECVAMTHGGREAVEIVSAELPDLIIMNYDLGDGMEGVELIRTLKSVVPRARLMVLTTAEHAVRMRAIMHAGADAVAGLSIPTDELFRMIEALTQLGKPEQPLVYPPGSLNLCLLGAEGDLPGLSDRERQVLKLIAKGLSVREIANHLGISRKTVESHRCNIRCKLEIPSIDELRQLAREHYGVVLPGESI